MTSGDVQMCDESEAPRVVMSKSAEETRAWGARLGVALRAGDVVRLEGELGAGKTTLVQGVIRALGSTARVTSPTFTLVNEYRTARGLTVYHSDAYRLGLRPVNEQAVDTLGLGDMLNDGGVLLVEWSEYVAALLPGDGLTVHIIYGAGDDERTLRLEGSGVRGRELAASIA